MLKLDASDQALEQYELCYAGHFTEFPIQTTHTRVCKHEVEALRKTDSPNDRQ